MPTIEQIYQQHIKPIPIVEQLHLINLIMQTDHKPSFVGWRDSMSEKVKIISF